MPLLLFTLLPLELTPPLSPTYAALLLLPGDRSHQLSLLQPRPHISTDKAGYTILSQPFPVAVDPRAQQVLAIVNQLRNLLKLFRQDCSLFSGQQRHISQQLYADKG